jgi:cytoskeletal protein CcmA (bactofilin family)
MFTKANKIEEPLRPVAPKEPAPPSLLSTDLRIQGDIACEGEIQVDGTIEGDIQTDVLVVGETALVKGEIRAETVCVHGNIQGQIKATNVSLSKSAHVLGDIIHVSLAIEQGAYLEGHCRRQEAPKKKESEGGINLLGKSSKAKSEPPPRKAAAADGLASVKSPI